MRWENLRANKCPKCNTKFGYMSFDTKGKIRCLKCRYWISEKRFSEIINSQVTQELQDKWDREEENKKI